MVGSIIKMMFSGKKRLYADAAAATPLSPAARKEFIRVLAQYGNPGALHHEAVAAKEELERARKTIAEAIGAHADEIVFTANGTEANNLAIEGVLRPLMQKNTGAPLHAITSAIEHQSVLEPLRALAREGLLLTELPVDAEGFVSAQALKDAITDKTVFVSIQLINSEIGTIQPVAEFAKIIRDKRSSRTKSSASLRISDASNSVLSPLPFYFHIDASQAPLWMPLGVEQLHADLLTIDGQKILGPKGVGALYVRRGTHIEPILHGGKQEKGLRGGTENAPAAAAFAAALTDAQKNTEANSRKISTLRDTLIADIVLRIPDTRVHGPKGERRAPNNVSLSIPGLDGEMAVIAMDREGIAISTRSACSVGEDEPSHVLKALGISAQLANSAIRITLLPSATRSDISRIAQQLQSVAKRYRIVV